MTELKTKLRVIILSCIAAAFIVVVIGYWSVFVPFLIGLLIAYLLDPIVMFLEKKSRLHLNRGVAVAIVFVFFLSLGAGLIMMIYPVLETGVTKLSDTIIKNEKNITAFFAKALHWVENLNLPLKIDKAKLLAEITTSI